MSPSPGFCNKGSLDSWRRRAFAAEARAHDAEGTACDLAGCLRNVEARAIRAEEEVKRLMAEVEMLRGVGCCEDGDGPCGACLKCARRERDEARKDRDWAIARWRMS